MTRESSWEHVYQASRYAFQQENAWISFVLEGLGPSEISWIPSVTLLTAWNPGSVEHSLAQNRVANAALLRDLVGRSLGWVPARGSSLPQVEPAWQEEGFAIFGLSRREAATLGQEWQQRAVVFLCGHAAELVWCADASFTACGMCIQKTAQ